MEDINKLAEEFKNNPLINPRTGRKIQVNGPIYNKLQKEFSLNDHQVSVKNSNNTTEVSSKKDNKVSVTLKKYRERKSPPVSATQFPDKEMEGNDGNKYISVPNKNGVYAWRIVK